MPDPRPDEPFRRDFRPRMPDHPDPQARTDPRDPCPCDGVCQGRWDQRRYCRELPAPNPQEREAAIARLRQAASDHSDDPAMPSQSVADDVNLLLAALDSERERVQAAEAAMVKARRQRDDYGSSQAVEQAVRLEAEAELARLREVEDRLRAEAERPTASHRRHPYFREALEWAADQFRPLPTADEVRGILPTAEEVAAHDAEEGEG